MAFLRQSAPLDLDAEIRGRAVALRSPVVADFEAWAALRNDSREHLAPWEPQWARDELTRSAFRRRLRNYARETREDQGYAYFMFASGTRVMIGALTISNVRRGVSQSASLGYWIGAGHQGRGLMTDAVRATLPFAFETLRLHRLEAACLPHNAPSRRVLEKCGFRREGIARRYLKINNLWQDHLLFGLIDDDPRLEARSAA